MLNDFELEKLEEEFIDNNLDMIHDKALFNKRFTEYIIFYNTQRLYKLLGLKSSLEYLIERGEISQWNYN